MFNQLLFRQSQSLQYFKYLRKGVIMKVASVRAHRVKGGSS